MIENRRILNKTSNFYLSWKKEQIIEEMETYWRIYRKKGNE